MRKPNLIIGKKQIILASLTLVLGMISSIVTTPAKGTLYDNLFLELFVDLYVVCAEIIMLKSSIFKFSIWALLLLSASTTASAGEEGFGKESSSPL